MQKIFSWILIILIIGGIVALLVRKTPSAETGLPSEKYPDNGAESVTKPEKETQPLPVSKSTTTMTIKTTKEGSGPAIASNQRAVVDYVGKLSDGTVFDASARHGTPFEFRLGAGMVIKGWDEGVLGMKVGETRLLTIPPELAYGASGIPGTIPPNATLIFEVTLQAIK